MKPCFLLLAFLSLFTVNAQVPGYVPSQNLQAWWSFSGSSNDQSGNGNNFTNNGATLSTDRNSASNSAYNFDGVDDYMALNTPSFAFGEDSSFTISFWTYFNNMNGGWVFGHGLTQGNGGAGKFCQFFNATSTGDIQWRANKQGSTWLIALASYTTNTWDHWVCVYHNKLMTIYKNGVSAGTQNFTYTGTGTSTFPFRLSTNFQSSGSNFPGKIDDLGVWNRALSQSEITDLYNGCAASVSGQPTDVKDVVGATVEFGTAASGSGISYQWQKKSGGSFQNISNGGQYAGVTTDTLEVSSLTMSNDGEEYRCVVSASGCADTSNPAKIELCGFLLMPANQTAAAGGNAMFTTQVADPTSTFQWQVDKGSGYGNVYASSQYINPQNDTLEINGVTTSMSGYKYHCVITKGECTGTSDEAVLTVNAVGIEEMMEAHSIEIYPNPVHDKMSISHSAQSENMSVEIISINGQKLYSGHLQAGTETVIDLKFINSGSYFVRIGDVMSIPFVIKK